ncbi:hypothetical protein ACFOEY_09920 [Paracandidimonas soli]
MSKSQSSLICHGCGLYPAISKYARMASHEIGAGADPPMPMYQLRLASRS